MLLSLLINSKSFACEVSRLERVECETVTIRLYKTMFTYGVYRTSDDEHVEQALHLQILTGVTGWSNVLLTTPDRLASVNDESTAAKHKKSTEKQKNLLIFISYLLTSSTFVRGSQSSKHFTCEIFGILTRWLSIVVWYVALLVTSLWS